MSKKTQGLSKEAAIVKKVVLLCHLVLLVLLLCACSNDEDVSSSSETAEDDTVELRMAWWGGQERHDRTLQVIELYEERNPHVKIVPEYSGLDGYFEKLSTQFASGDAPDIIQYGGNLNDYVSKGVVLPLDDYVGNEIDVSQHDQSMIEAATFDGKFYGVTLGTNAWGVLLNKTLFDRAGVDIPDDEWTWEDFKEIAVALSDSLDGAYGTEYFDHNGFGIFIDQKGKVLHENGEPGFEQEDVEDWFTLWEDFRNSGAVVPPDIQAASSTTPEQSMIVAGQVAMQLIPSNQYGAFTNASQDEFVFHSHPYGDLGRSGVSIRPSQFLAGYSETKHPEEVAKFLDFMVNDEEATAILGSDRGVPVNSEVRSQLMSEASEIDKVVYAYVDWVSRTSDSPYVPNLPAYNETEALFKKMSEQIAFGQLSVQEGAERYWQELNEVLDAAN